MNEVTSHSVDTGIGVHLTERAMKHLLGSLSTQKDCKGLRFSVKKTGCSGLSYVVDYVKETTESDRVFPLQDDYQIFIENSSYPYLKNMSIDYVKQGLNYKLTFTNPNQTGQCGCGESFTVE